MPPKKKGGKKDDDWDDVETTATKKLAALKVEESAFDDESDEEPAKPQPKAKGRPGMSAFLMMEDDDDEKSEKSEKSEAEDAPVESKPAAKADTAKDKKAKNKGKKGKKQTTEDDELDALLENLNKPEEAPAGKKKEKLVGEAQVVEEGEAKEAEPTPDKEVEDKKKSKKKKKDKEKTAGEQPATADAEKKEDQGEDGEAKEGDEEAGDDKKKKKKKGKKEEKPKKNKQAEAIKEMLRRKEEAELEAKRLAQEEEERILAAEKKREEEERIEKERRDAEKLRKKQKEEQLKKEGKWLTPAQRAKQQQQRARLGAQFDKIKEEAPTKKVVYEDLSKKKQQQQKERNAQLAEAASTSKEIEKEDSPVEEKIEKEELAEEKQDEPLDDWELADVDETKKETEAKETTQAKEVAVSVKEEQRKESSESEEESSEEESDESEEDESESEEESSSEDEGTKKETKEMKMERIRLRLQQRREKAIAEKSLDNLRAPIICVLGHVDTGKTKMLDTIRRTNVQDGEAGGITQQIGATQVPKDAIIERCKQVRDFRAAEVKIPGFLIIDTPGHESFANLRSRGSSLCDFAILVVDLMHGLEQQTLESIKLLVKRKTPFVVALNKIDRLHMYESSPRKDVYVHLGTQANNVKLEFKKRYEEVVVQFAEQGLNVCLSNDKKKMADPDYIPMVPTSAYCGDGIGNLMAFIAEMAQSKYSDRLAFIEELDATVMEVKAIPGLGTTIDVILVNGRLKNNDIIVLSGIDGPIVSQIRDLKMPEPLRELRVKSEYRSFKEIQGAQGVKVLAKGLEKALAGLPLYVVNQADEIDLLQAECEAALSKALTSIKKKPEGVYVQASTLGSLEALLEFLKTQKIPYANVNIGPVHKKDVNKALAMKQHKEEYACILAFDVKVEREAQLAADREGVRIFQADIIYHLEDDFLKYREELRQKYRREHEHIAVFPCKLRVLPQHIFNARNPIVCGVSIEAGQLKKGAPICVPSKECIFLGNVASIERNHEEVGLAKAGEEVCIKIENTTGEAPKLYGRHFTHEDFLVTRLTRESIDACKAYFRDDLSKADWQLVIELKKTLDIL